MSLAQGPVGPHAHEHTSISTANPTPTHPRTHTQVRGSYEAAAYVRLRALKARLDPGGLLRAL